MMMMMMMMEEEEEEEEEDKELCRRRSRASRVKNLGGAPSLCGSSSDTLESSLEIIGIIIGHIGIITIVIITTMP